MGSIQQNRDVLIKFFCPCEFITNYIQYTEFDLIVTQYLPTVKTISKIWKITFVSYLV